MSTVQPFDDISFCVGGFGALERSLTAPALPVFFDEALAFFDDLSKLLRAKPECRAYPDIAAFAFWCRRASLSSMRKNYTNDFLLGRGMALHISPGNVPLNFAYSLAVGLLAGNSNAVRLPREKFPQAELLCGVLSELLKTQYPELSPYAVCFRCGHDSPALSALSGECAVRIIWGGDDTVSQIRRLPLKPRSVELTFADRYSLSVINSDAWLSSADKDSVAGRFFQDSYWSDQLACTAPKAVFWLGSRISEARSDFWPRVSSRARAFYHMPDIMAIKKLEAALLLANRYSGAKLSSLDNLAVRVELPKLLPEQLELCPGGGFFVEYRAEALEALLPLATEKCQTITAFGVEKSEFESFIRTYRPRGIDRIVSFGHSMDFSLCWDGYDLIRSMSRSVELNTEQICNNL